MNTNKRIILSLIFISILFFSLMAYLTYFEYFQKDEVIANSYNQRLNEYEESILRGSIFDRNGTVLAQSEGEGEKQKRNYPYKNTYSQIIGYSSKIYGKSLIEARYNKYLLGINELKVVMDLKNEITGQKSKGNDIYLTIDHELQVLGEKLLKGKSGAIVAMDPKTGEILAMVSKPDYNPNEESLTSNWTKLVESANSPFLPRATQGLYAPGSTFKVATASSALQNGMGEKRLNDTGSVTIDGKKFQNYGEKKYGEIGMEEALTYSSNTYFAELGVSLGEENLKELVKVLGFNKNIDFELPVKKSSFPYSNMSKTDMAAVAIGQGKLLVTPFHMAMIAASIANDGLMMEPVLVKTITGITGSSNVKPTDLYRTMTVEQALSVNQMMQQVVNKGTGSKAIIKGIQVAGKTGTAENELSKDDANKAHAWFIGFAPAEDPKIAIAVIVEYNGSTGGQVAAPIARQLINKWLK